MTTEIKVGEPVITINRGSAFMVMKQNGEIDQTRPEGLFTEDTRFISTYQMYINDQPWQRVTSAAIAYYAARFELTNPHVLTPDGKGWIDEQTIALTLERTINTGMHEWYHIVNYSGAEAHFMLELAMRSDFADVFEVKANRLTRRGQIETKWEEGSNELRTSYHHEDFSRSVVYHVVESTSQPAYANGRLVFEVRLKPKGEWDAHCDVLLLHQGRRRRATALHRGHGAIGHTAHDFADASSFARFQQAWLHSCSSVSSPNHAVSSAYLQAVEDMGALRLPEHDLGADVWLPAAGVPWFVALFGRDSLLVSYQTMMVHAPFARGALRELARYQAADRDDWRDAQPGKILHELRYGELAHFHLIPHTPYYGTADATILYLIVLHEYYKWTGDRALVEELRGVADRCLQWIDEYGDLDGDGFQEWKTFSDQGYENMAWKDSGDCIVYRDGTQAHQPKGTCELQAYVYDAKVRMAELYDVLGDGDKAKKLRAEAADLQRRFDETFWMEDEGAYALGLDANKKQIDAVTSNAGQCLWSGIALPERARRMAARLFESDLWCGWGIRTLSSRNAAYNPYSYQRGSVWPHDNGIIAAGLKRYGFGDQVNRIADGIFAAAMYFDAFRLPEVFAGLERKPTSFPAQYIGANVPQAWAAGSVFHLLRAMLGVRPDAPNATLYVNPTLPDWLPELDLDRLRIGSSSLDLHFWRDAHGSHVAVKHQEGPQIQVEQEAPGMPVSPAAGQNPAGATDGRHEQRPTRARRTPASKQPEPDTGGAASPSGRATP